MARDHSRYFKGLALQVALEEWHERIPEYEIEPGKNPQFSAGIREVMYLPLVWKKAG